MSWTVVQNQGSRKLFYKSEQDDFSRSHGNFSNLQFTFLLSFAGMSTKFWMKMLRKDEKVFKKNNKTNMEVVNFIFLES